MKKNICILAVCGGLYWLNRLVLLSVTSGWLRRFLACWFHDVLVGPVLLSLTSLLLIAVKRPPLRRWCPMALILLGAGVVWECFAPLWKPGAVFDWWDFAAYQAGGLLYLPAAGGTARQKQNSEKVKG